MLSDRSIIVLFLKDLLDDDPNCRIIKIHTLILEVSDPLYDRYFLLRG